MLRQLEPDVCAKLRSGVAITNVAQCVEELVLNSIDAGAISIAVRLDLTSYKVQVVDNGPGISSEELDLVGTRYCTSKCHSLGDLDNLCFYGYRGEALASISAVAAILEIETRPKSCTGTFTKHFKHGKPMSSQKSKYNRPCVGCTVSVYDLFYNLPVRRKSSNEALELEKVRQCIQCIALIHPNVSLSLRNEVTLQTVLQTHKTNGVLSAFSQIFGISKSRHLVEVSSDESDVFKIQGYLSKEGNHNNSLQFIYINKRLVLKTKLHKLINTLFSKSSIVKRRHSSNQQGKSKYSPALSGSPSKRDCHGIYVLNISCPLDEYDITFDPKKTLVEFKNWESILSRLEKLIVSFLKQEGLVIETDIDVSVSDILNGSPESDEVMLNAGDCDMAVSGLGDNETVKINTNSGFSDDRNFGKNISTNNSLNSLQSVTVHRKQVPVVSESLDNNISISASSPPQVASANGELLVDSVIPKVAAEKDECSSTSLETTEMNDKIDDESGSIFIDSQKAFDDIDSSPEEFTQIKSSSSSTSLHEDSLGMNVQVAEVEQSPSCAHREFDKDSSENSVKGGDIKSIQISSNVPKSLSNFRKPSSCLKGRSGNSTYPKGITPLRRLREKCCKEGMISASVSSSLQRFRLENKRSSAPKPISEGLKGLQDIREKLSKPPSEASKLNAFVAETSVSEFENHGENVDENETMICDDSSALESSASCASETACALENERKRPAFQNESDSCLAKVTRHHESQNERENQTVADLIMNSTSIAADLFQQCHTKEKSSGFQKVRVEPPPPTRHFLTTDSLIQTAQNFNFEEALDCSSLSGKHGKTTDISKSHPSASSGNDCELFVDSAKHTLHHLNNNRRGDLVQVSEMQNARKHEHEKSSFLYKESEEDQNSSFCKDRKMTVNHYVHDTAHSKKYDSDILIDNHLVAEERQKSSEFKIPLAKGIAPVISTEIGSKLLNGSSKVTLNSSGSSISSNKKKVSLEENSSSIDSFTTSDQLLYKDSPIYLHERNASIQNSDETAQYRESAAKPQPFRSYSVLSSDVNEKFDDFKEDSSADVRDSGFDSYFDENDSSFIAETQGFEIRVLDGEGSLEADRHNQFSRQSHDLCPVSVSDDVTMVTVMCDSTSVSEKDKNDISPHGDRIVEGEKQYVREEFDACSHNAGSNSEGESNFLLEMSDHGTVSEKHRTAELSPAPDSFSSNSAQGQAPNSANGRWTSRLDKKTGMTMYINLQTGLSQYDVPDEIRKNRQEQIEHTEHSTKQHFFLSHDAEPFFARPRSERMGNVTDDSVMSPNTREKLENMLSDHLDNQEDEICNKWKNAEEFSSSLQNGTDEADLVENLMDTWQNPVFSLPEQEAMNIETDTNSRSNFLQRFIHPQRLNKSMLATSKVLGQVDNKFIACLFKSEKSQMLEPDLLVIVDQHAAHERVRLEQLLEDAYEENGEKDKMVISSKVTQPIQVSLSEPEIRVMCAYRKSFKRIGITFQVDKAEKGLVHVCDIPACFLQKEASEVKRGRAPIVMEMVEVLIKEHVELLQATSGAGSLLPRTISNVLNSQACHGAIKFGDPLEKQECEELLSLLCDCKLPFQCAHGRPSTIPILDLDHLKNKLPPQKRRKPKLWRLSEGIAAKRGHHEERSETKE